MTLSPRHIAIKRQFCAEDDYNSLSDPYRPRISEDFHDPRELGWSDIIYQKRVVILGEAKCGKTHEFRQQVNKLHEKEETAFFIRLENLKDNDLKDVLIQEEVNLLDKWIKASSSKEAWFFLDAVDELKLKDGDFKIALRKLQKNIADKSYYAHIFISCRPADWNQQIDINSLKAIFPYEKNKGIDKKSNGTTEKSPEENFICVVEQWHPHSRTPSREIKDKKISHEEEKGGINHEPSVYALLPLNQPQIIQFAEEYDTSKAEGLREKLDHDQIWHFFQTPSDIIDGLNTIKDSNWVNYLGEHISAGIDVKLQESTYYSRKPSLSLEKAREGAECLALALILTKQSSLLIEKSIENSQGLIVKDILTDWGLNEQKELLSRGLFDFSSVNAVQFHHRSDREFLAARRLLKNLNEGLKIRDLKQLLFADTWQEKVVIPSMEPIAAWLALWNEDIRSEVKRRKPEILFQQSIPSSMPIIMRRDILREFVQSYKENDSHVINIALSDVKRFGHEDLDTIVRELWDEAYTGHDTRELMLELICQTPLPECTNLALKAAFDKSLSIKHRIYGCLSILENEKSEEKFLIGKAFMSRSWPERIIYSAIPYLFPGVLSKDELIQLLKNTKEPKNSTNGVSYSLRSLIRNLDSIENIRSIRSSLAKEVWDNREQDSSFYHGGSLFSHFVGAIFLGCALDKRLNTKKEIEAWAWDAIIAMHFDDVFQPTIEKKNATKVHQRIRNEAQLREAYFWAELKMHIDLEGYDTDSCYRHLDQLNIILGSLSEEDFSWLFNALNNKSNTERRYAAFYAIMGIWKKDRSQSLAKRVRRAIEDLPEIISDYDRFLNPPKTSFLHKEDKKRTRQEEKDERTKQINIETWRRWHHALEENPESAFAEEGKSRTLDDFFIWLDGYNESVGTSSWGNWHDELIKRSFSNNVVKLLLPELSNYWRKSTPQLWSKRESNSKNSFSWGELHALSAIKSEAENPAWIEELTKKEVKLATQLSTIELNGFASFYPSLEGKYRNEVHKILLQELDNQIDQVNVNNQIPMVQEIYYHGTDILKEVAAHQLLGSLHLWPIGNEASMPFAFSYASNLIVQHVPFQSRYQLIQNIKNRFNKTDRNSDEYIFLLSILTALDLQEGCNRILELTNPEDTHYDSEFSMKVFGQIFGDSLDGGTKPYTSDFYPPKQLELLTCLVHRAYEIAHPSDDIEHEGIYSPGIRDYAERARDFLFNTLVKFSSMDTYDALEKLERLPVFSYTKDRLKQLRLEMAAHYSEFDAMSISEFRSFDRNCIRLPRNNQTMHQIMINRLDDYEHYITESEFSNLSILIRVNHEIELRRVISGWLNDNSRGSYRVIQEAVKKNEKRTDIRLISTVVDIESTIELKHDGEPRRWSGTDLENALQNQLVGQYLNHERCQSGCLLIVMQKQRQWQNPHTKKKMSLCDTVEWLQEIANEIMNERPDLLISVKGIDLTKG